jgi:hypothetical protein
MIFWITDDDDAASTSFDYIALGDALCRVVSALGMKIRTNFANDGAHVFFWKDYNSVHIRQRRQNFRAFFGRHNGPPFTLQRAHGSIAVHRDNQLSAEFPCGTQVAHMANVQHVEAPVGQRDAIAGAPPIRYTLPKFAARNNLLME